MHTLDRQAEQLAVARITVVPAPDLSWLVGSAGIFFLPDRVALLIPGCSASQPGKRWPARNYAALARSFIGRGVRPVLIGGGIERNLMEDITAEAPGAINLCERTEFGDIAALARVAEFTVGNDTGPTHIAAARGCPTLVLFGQASDPTRTAPRGPEVRILRREWLASLPVTDVDQAAAALPARPRE